MIFTITILFKMLGWTFFGGAIVLSVGLYTNYRISLASAKLQDVYMTRQDARISLTTECLNNIKIIKIYGWTDIFIKMITDFRNKELQIMIKQYKLGVANISSLYFFPQLLQTVSFCSFIYFKGNISLPDAFLIMMVFRLLIVPLRTLPLFIGEFIAFIISMQRI